MNSVNRQKGVSLIELMIAIAILAIILLIGVPSFQTFFESSRARTITNDMAGALQLARSEALKRRNSIQVCVRNVDGTACGADATNWNSGWLLLDTSNNQVIRVWNPLPANINGDGLVAPAAGISFNSTGMASSAETFDIDITGNERCISVNMTGRVSVRQGACS